MPLCASWGSARVLHVCDCVVLWREGRGGAFLLDAWWCFFSTMIHSLSIVRSDEEQGSRGVKSSTRHLLPGTRAFNSVGSFLSYLDMFQYDVWFVLLSVGCNCCRPRKRGSRSCPSRNESAFMPHAASQAVLSRMPPTLHAIGPALTALRAWCKQCLRGR